MVEATERLMNLALFLASSAGTVTAEDVRREVYGYPAEQDDPAFKRMLERDKDTLRSSGLAIESDGEGRYRLDPSATYIGALSVTADEAAAITAASVALAEDPSFPFAEDLRLALTKISSQISASRPHVAACLADEEPNAQGEAVEELSEAVTSRKNVSFEYTNALGKSAQHEVEPYGLFLHSGRWYLVGRDRSKDEVRTYAVTRMSEIAPNTSAPKSPDFERPEHFDVSDFIRLPFQYGPESQEFEAVVLFAPRYARKARRLATTGAASAQIDGSVRWTVHARSPEALCRFLVENGPGLTIESPADIRRLLSKSLVEVVKAHA